MYENIGIPFLSIGLTKLKNFYVYLIDKKKKKNLGEKMLAGVRWYQPCSAVVTVEKREKDWGCDPHHQGSTHETLLLKGRYLYCNFSFLPFPFTAITISLFFPPHYQLYC